MKRLIKTVRKWKARILSWSERTNPEQDGFEFDRELLPALRALARQENMTVEEMANELLHYAVEDRRTAEAYLRLWQSLTPREQETATLACLGYTNQQIAERMIISANTVKTHIRNILYKFDLNSKSELREALAGWDWEGIAGDSETE